MPTEGQWDERKSKSPERIGNRIQDRRREHWYNAASNLEHKNHRKAVLGNLEESGEREGNMERRKKRKSQMRKTNDHHFVLGGYHGKLLPGQTARKLLPRLIPRENAQVAFEESRFEATEKERPTEDPRLAQVEVDN